MYIKDIADIICEKGTESENIPVRVQPSGGWKTLWEGKASDLKTWTSQASAKWLIVDITRDPHVGGHPEIYNNVPKYNQPYLITVI